MGKKMSYCCQDKKYFSELCEKCVKDMTTFDPESLNYQQHSEYSAKEWPGSEIFSKCECGSKTINGPGHSHWCPEYEPK